MCRGLLSENDVRGHFIKQIRKNVFIERFPFFVLKIRSHSCTNALLNWKINYRPESSLHWARFSRSSEHCARLFCEVILEQGLSIGISYSVGLTKLL